jgi:hypothetical protein
MRNRPRYLLLLEHAHPPVRPGDPEPPPEVTLRRAIKCLGRAFGLKCVSVEELTGRAGGRAAAAEAGGPEGQS